ncbi:site-specific DNA-methyltransferase [Candidatus Bipolaricaulota bacterium]|nr:site-specific DNA-methyltransferase [Candidatus Bipolaricaulota bacterium]
MCELGKIGTDTAQNVPLKQSRRGWWKGTYKGAIYRHAAGEIVRDDALHCLESLCDGCADIVFLDPPFNLGKRYGKNGSHHDRKRESEYVEYMEKVIARSAKVLKDGGALYLYHIPKWAIRLSPYLEEHLDFRHWIAISMKNGFARGDHLYPAHYALLYYTKGKPGSFHRPKVPKPICAKCKRDLRDYGGYAKYVADGINLSDVWDDVSPVRHRKSKTRAANELPLVIPERVVTISGCREGLIVDPFAGSGSTLVAAMSAGMRFVAADCEEEYCELMFQRISGVKHQ